MPKPKYHAKAKRQAKPRERKAKRIVGIWETCKTCGDQMAGELPPGQRCWVHNPPPEDDRPYVRSNSEIYDIPKDIEEIHALQVQSAGEITG